MAFDEKQKERKQNYKNEKKNEKKLDYKTFKILSMYGYTRNLRSKK